MGSSTQTWGRASSGSWNPNVQVPMTDTWKLPGVSLILATQGPVLNSLRHVSGEWAGRRGLQPDCWI